MAVYSRLRAPPHARHYTHASAPRPTHATPGPDCAQEVLNLLLTGFGVSNVFDGARDLGGMVMRGISARPAIGILSELEALRYVEARRRFRSTEAIPRHPPTPCRPTLPPLLSLASLASLASTWDTWDHMGHGTHGLGAAQVGSLFKQPSQPLWVVASESHYSLLFSLSGAVQQSSPLAALEEVLLRAFSAYDAEGNGFVSSR